MALKVGDDCLTGRHLQEFKIHSYQR